MINKERLQNLSNEIWKGAIKLRGKFKAKNYPSVILPMIMIRRIECVLEQKRAEFKSEILERSPDLSEDMVNHRIKIKENGLDFFNKSNWTLASILEESSSQVEANFREYINSYSPNIDEIIEKFDYRTVITQVVKANRLASIIELAADEDFSPTRLSNIEMGYVYEELLQKFSQDDAKDTGEHFTPREIIHTMVDLMQVDFDPATATKAISLYDPACGTGGMLSVAKEHLFDQANNDAEQKQVEELVLLNGQEYLPQNYAVCQTDMILKGETRSKITHGNSLIPDIESILDDGDKHSGSTFDYMLSNPPFGVDWGEYQSDALKFSGSRYRWGTPEKKDGALLFLLTMIEKMKPVDKTGKGGSKIAVLFNGSPLSNGDALQGESEIRRHILEADLLDCIVMMPDQMFYNTGIYTYIWLLSNNKPAERKGRVTIINAREQFEKEPKSFGNKRNRISQEHRAWISQQYQKNEANDDCKLFKTTDFAFHKVRVTFWQADENDVPMWIREPFGVKLTGSNAKKKHELYGDMTFYIIFSEPTFTHENEYITKDVISLEFEYNGEKPFDTVVADLLKTTIPEFEKWLIKDIKKWFNASYKECDYYHRNYIVDNEYIPFNAEQPDKAEHINQFLADEIDYEIIAWEELDQLGYEVLPNKYFYKYVEPAVSDELIEEFWALEDQAKNLLDEIKVL